MKKLIYLSALFIFCGCTPYVILGYKKNSGNFENQTFKVGYFINYNSLNKLPKRCLVFYMRENQQIEDIDASSKLYGKLHKFENKVFDMGGGYLYFTDLKFEKEKTSLERIKNDTIKVNFKKNGKISTILFYD